MNEQRFVCVYFDDQSNQSKYCRHAQDVLGTIVDSFRSFNYFEECLDFILNMEDFRIILILFDTFGEEILPIIHSSKQIHSIYIFNPNSSIKKDWKRDFTKIEGFFNDINIICQKIEENLNPMKTKLSGISFLSSSDINSRDLNRQDPLFMYSQLLKEILLNNYQTESDEEIKYEMIHFCRNIYTNDQTTLNIINQFEEDFLPELAIYWYTRESFLYKMLNKALWTPEPDVLYKLRYFLRHLHQQIVTQSSLQHIDRSSIIVYRGQNISGEQIKKLQESVGGFLSFNNFLSTSLQRQIALNFLAGPEIGVLFEIYIDTRLGKYPFANIEHFSYQQGEYNESEYLFSMGTVFRIVGMDTEDYFHRVQLMLTNDIDEQLSDYTKRTREDIRSTSCFLTFLKLMYQLKQYDSLDRFVQIFNNDYSFALDSDVLDNIHNTFGLIYHNRGELNEALEHFQKSVSICLNSLSADHPKLSVTYNNIGSVYSSQSDYKKALTFHQLALDCLLNSENINILSLITYTSNIATIYFQEEKYNDALIHLKRVLELQKEHLGEDDPSLTDTYNMISIIYYRINDFEQTASFHEKAVSLQKDTSQFDLNSSVHCSITRGAFCKSQGEYKEALQHYNRALQLQQQYLLPNNPSLATTYNFIADVYSEQNHFDKSLSNHLKALEIEETSLSNDHPSIAKSYFHISKDYVALSYWSDALDYAFKAIEQIKKSPQTDIDTLTSFNDHLAQIYYQRNEYDKALIYFKKALDFSLTHLSDNHKTLIPRYYGTAETYYKLEKYNEALSFYQKTLNIELKTLPDNAKTIATTYHDISASYFHLERLDEALIAANQAYDQINKTLSYNHPEVVKMRDALDMIKMIQMAREGQD